MVIFCRYGGWVIDGFPVTRDNWASMIENNLLPDFVLHLEDSHTQTDYLLKRFTDLHRFPANVKINAEKDNDQVYRERVNSIHVWMLVPVFPWPYFTTHN